MKKIASVILGLILAITFAPTSFAHAELKSSNPVEGSTLEVMPSTISVTFNENLLNLEGEQVNTIALLDGNSEDVSLSEITIDNATISAKVNVDSFVLPGEYRIIYRVVSADGHPIEGEVPFIYAPAEEASSGDEAQSGDESSPDAQVESQSDDGLNSEVISGVVALILLAGLLLWLRKRN
ncbi:MAG: copper resistance protein CopC [Actinomycetota bacterium]